MKLKTLALAAGIAMLPGLSSATWAPYFGIGGGLQYMQETTSITNTVAWGNTYNSNRPYPLFFHNNNLGGFSNFFVGLGNKLSNGVYTAIELNAAYNPASYTSSSNNFDFPLNKTPYVDLATSHTTTFQMPWRFGLSGILGYYITPRVMPYARLGFTAAPFNANYSVTGDFTAPAGIPSPLPSTNQIVNVNNDGYMFGGTIGLGSRFYLNDNWFLGLEGDYTRFFNVNQQTPSWGYNGDNQLIVHNTSLPYNYQYVTGVWSLMASFGYQF